MTLTYRLSGQQKGPGAPVLITGQLSSDDVGDSTPYVGVGVTTSASVPTTYAGLAHVDGLAAFNDAFWDTNSEGLATAGESGVSTQYSDVHSLSARVRLDSNYVAGRYIWLVGFASATPGGSDAVLGHAGPYHIR